MRPVYLTQYGVRAVPEHTEVEKMRGEEWSLLDGG